MLKSVTKTECLGYKPQRGCIPDTFLYRLTLECGHTQVRTESSYDVKRAKCKKCN